MLCARSRPGSYPQKRKAKVINMKTLAFLPVVIVALAGCAVGPNYKRPLVSAPTDYRAATPSPAAPASSLGNENWWQLYQDPVLVQLIHTALQQNYDVRIAATRVLQAQAQVGIARADQLPSANVGAGVFSEGNPKVSNLFPAYEVNGGQLTVAVVHRQAVVLAIGVLDPAAVTAVTNLFEVVAGRAELPQHLEV